MYGAYPYSDVPYTNTPDGLNNLPPTVVLNAPADVATISDSTPTLNFTGTDANSNTIEYNVQIDTVNTFNSGGVAVVNTYYFDASDAGPTDPGSIWSNAASAFDGSTGTYASVNISGSGSSNYLTASGTNAPTSGIPISQVVGRVYSASGAGADAILATPTGGWTWQVVNNLTTLLYRTEKLDVSLTANANFSTNLGEGLGFAKSVTLMPITSGRTINVSKIEIDVTSSLPPVLLSKLSTTDAGFADITNAVDVHPFASGDRIDYTVQAGDVLPSGTYYWRVAAIDPLGSNTYGVWSSIRSFTVTGAGIKVWNGSAWGYKPVKVWNGSAWVVKG